MVTQWPGHAGTLNRDEGMIVSKNFILQELVNPVAYEFMGEKSIQLIDNRLITLIQFMRDYFAAPIIINDWHKGGNDIDSGFRMPESKTGRSLSQHKFGRALDINIRGFNDYDALRKIIMDNWPLFKEHGLTTLESNTPTWLHLDIRNTNISDLYLVPYQ